MSVIVVGGRTKGAGKTALICGLISAMPEAQWTAVKITSHTYRGVPLWEEVTPGRGADTERFLAAGARRALLAATPEANPPLVLLGDALREDLNVIYESNRILAHVRPDICIGMLGEASVPSKPSFDLFLERADAFVSQTGADISYVQVRKGVPIFRLATHHRISPEMLAWVRARLSPSSRQGTAPPSASHRAV